MPKVTIHTSSKPAYGCAICGVSVKGVTPGELSSQLFDKYKIHTTGIVCENISCTRVTPHVYTSIKNVDKLVKALNEISMATK